MNPIWMNAYAPVTVSKVAAQNSKGWIVGTNGSVYSYDAYIDGWVQMINLPTTTAFSSIAASPDGSVIATSAGSAYLYSSQSWDQVFITSNAVSVSIGDSNHFITVDQSGPITRSIYGYLSSLGNGVTKISASANLNQIYGVDATGLVKRWNSTTNTWNSISGKTLIQIHVSNNSAGTVQVVGTDSNGAGWSYNTTNNSWISIAKPNPTDTFKWIEAGDGYIWCLLSSGAVYRGYF